MCTTGNDICHIYSLINVNTCVLMKPLLDMSNPNIYMHLYWLWMGT